MLKITMCTKGGYTQFFWLTIETKEEVPGCKVPQTKEHDVTVEESYNPTSDSKTYDFVSETLELTQEDKDQLIEYVNTKVE